MRITGIIKVKCLRAPFELIRSASEYRIRKKKLVKSLPSVRKKQLWETLMEHELDHFYSQQINAP